MRDEFGTSDARDTLAGELAGTLLAWYDRHARDLPWRVPPGSNHAPDPYRIWLSEVMLQQTTVAAVKTYFERFTTLWPRVTDLAEAEDDRVMAEWAGLGYYARARNLLKCARTVARDLGGTFPDSEEGLLALPGIGPYTAAAISAIAFDRPAVVLDADALTAFAEAPEVLFDLLHDRCVLSPHGGEFARLFPDIAARLAETPTRGPAYSKVDATRAAAERAGCVVLYKGADTVIASPLGACVVNSAHYDRAAPWLATAGSGDVLAGFITGLLARGLSPMDAAQTGAWLHVECALMFGPGLIAEDLPEQLPAVFRALGI